MSPLCNSPHPILLPLRGGSFMYPPMDFVNNWMQLENSNLSEVTQTQKETHGMSSTLFKSCKRLIPH